MTGLKKRPIRTAPINKSPSFIPAEPIRSLDRIQLSIRNRGSNYDLILQAFRDSMTQTKESRKKHKKGYKVISIFKRKGLSVYVTYWGGYWFSVQVMNPDEDIQLFLRDLISQVLPLKAVSLSQVEFALDFHPDDPSKVESLFTSLSQHAVLKRLRAGGATRYKGTFYQGRKGQVHSGSHGVRVYLKPEHGPRFVRVELEAHKNLLKRRGLDFQDIPLSPDDLDVLDYVVFRRKIDLDVVSERCARARMSKSSISCPRRYDASFRTLRSAIRNILSYALRSNPRYEIDDLTAAEQICLLKAKLSPRSRFVFCLERHFSAFPRGRCGRVRWDT